MHSSAKPAVKYRKDYQPSQYLIKQTKLQFELFEDYVIVSAQLSITSNTQKTNKTLKPLILDGIGLELLSISINEIPLQKIEFIVDKQYLTINKVSQQFTLETKVKIFPNKNTSLQGLYCSNQKFCTQCEAEGFRNITYYLDRPEIMSEFFVSIEADKKLYPLLLSNGNLLDSGELANQRHFTSWHDPYPKPSYLFALVGGDLDCLEDSFTTMSGRVVQLQLFVDKGKLSQCRFAMDSLIKSMIWDEENFGREYDLDLYMIVAVGDFNMGAMENKGLNIFNTAYVFAHEKTATDADFEGVERVIAHEYFHNWTGNRVTCRNWFQLSLKEGLTVFRDQKFSEDMQSAAVERIEQVKIIRSSQFVEDAGPMAHPIRPDSYIEMNNFYTVTVYNKGAEVIRMMHTLLGTKGFRAGMDCYFDRHDGQAVTCEDFIKAMEDANKVDWQLFRNWYRQAGTPQLNIHIKNIGIKTLSIEFEQSCPATSEQNEKEPFMIPVKIGFIDQQGKPLKFKLSNTKSSNAEQHLIVVTQRQQKVTIEIENTDCIPSLLRDFSAPLKHHYNYSQNDLATLFANDSNSFNRWDAGQNLMSIILLSKEESISNGDLSTISKAINNILTDKTLDNSLKSLAVQLPCLNSLIGELSELSLDLLFKKHQQLKQYIASSLEKQWLDNYDSINAKSHQTASDRRLKNIALNYLMICNEDHYALKAINQQNRATNMTDEISALQAICSSNLKQKQFQVQAFYDKWKDEDLVLDKWFSAQIKPNDQSVFNTINELLSHKKFSYTNPNKVRSVISAFVSANPQQFHSPTGAGYELLAEIIIKLNRVNPQISARLAKQFGQWKKFDNKRQAIIMELLENILSLSELSNDVFEVVNKNLNS